MRVVLDISIKGFTEVPEELVSGAIKKFVTNRESTKEELIQAIKEDMEDNYSILTEEIEVKIELIKNEET
jgi:hypothetical protein